MVFSDRTRGKVHTLKQDVWALEQVPQRGCAVSILGDSQHSPGHDCGKPCLAEPALSLVGWPRESPEVIAHLSSSVAVTLQPGYQFIT